MGQNWQDGSAHSNIKNFMGPLWSIPHICGGAIDWMPHLPSRCCVGGVEEPDKFIEGKKVKPVSYLHYLHFFKFFGRCEMTVTVTLASNSDTGFGRAGWRVWWVLIQIWQGWFHSVAGMYPACGRGGGCIHGVAIFGPGVAGIYPECERAGSRLLQCWIRRGSGDVCSTKCRRQGRSMAKWTTWTFPLAVRRAGSNAKH